MQDALGLQAPSLTGDVCHPGTVDRCQNLAVYQTLCRERTARHHVQETHGHLSHVGRTCLHLPETPGTSGLHRRSSGDLVGNPVWVESPGQIPAQ